MQRLEFSWGAVVVCALACGLLSSCDARSRGESKSIRETNLALSMRKLPELPDGVTDARCWRGGTFAKYMSIKFTASADQALEYLRKTGAGYYIEFEIEGESPRILATHSLTGSTPVDTGRPHLYPLVGRTGFHSKPWFKSIYDIRHGWYYHDFRGAPVYYYMFYDVDSRQFYVYWSYS